MRTALTPAQIADPHIAAVERNLRACVHCGICTASCPTYLLTGDERDGPRGRIVMMQRMFEAGGVPSAETVRHVDRCLSCLGCRTACPSSVDYARLVDAARAHIHDHYARPWRDRFMRGAIVFVMPRPNLVKFAVSLTRFFEPITRRLPGRLGLMAVKAASMSQRRTMEAENGLAQVPARSRVLLMPGCVRQALAPSIDRAAARVLARRGATLVPLRAAGCCGALAHHLGRRDEAKRWAKRAIEAYETYGAADAILITATGCAAHLKDYPHLFADEPEWRTRAEAFAAKVRDFSELAQPAEATSRQGLRIAYHAPCSLQHGLRLKSSSEKALARAGYDVVDIPEGQLCCGSAGSYSLLQPDMAQALRRRKLDSIALLAADAVASPNIGCLIHLAGPDAPPFVHPAELIDWAEGGPRPQALAAAKSAVSSGKTG